MNLASMFSSLLIWLVGFVLYVPFTVLRLVSALLPACSNFGITSFTAAISSSIVNWIRFYYPILKFIPWAFVWNFVSAVLLYIFFKWLWTHLPKYMPIIISYWWIVVIFYVMAGLINFFTSYSFLDSNVFTEVFGNNPTSTGQSGTGFGGSGGGSW